MFADVNADASRATLHITVDLNLSMPGSVVFKAHEHCGHTCLWASLIAHALPYITIRYDMLFQRALESRHESA